MKNGLITEDGKRIYYKDGKPFHAGLIREDGKIYYISSGGRAVTGAHDVHSKMTNGILKRGTYTFGEDGVLVPDSYVPLLHHKSRRHSSRKQTAALNDNQLAILIAVILILSVLGSLIVMSGADRENPDDPFRNDELVEVTAPEE